MNNGIWNKERGPIGETGDTGPIGPAGPVFDGTTPLSELTVTGLSSFESTGLFFNNTNLLFRNVGNSNNGLAIKVDTNNDTIFNFNAANTSKVLKIQSATIDIITVSESSVNILKPTTISGSTFPIQAYGDSNDGIRLGGNGGRGIIRPIIAGVEQGSSDFTYQSSGDYWLFENKLVVNQSTSNGVDKFEVGSDTDISASIGRLAIYGLSDIALISHYNFKGLSTAYALLQDSNGKAILNSASGQTTSIRVANVDIATFSGTDISLFEPVIMTALPTSDPSVAGALWNSSGTVMISAG